ncbi:MAG: phage tail tape measure protein [Dermatophilaceae bacterium]|nr:phage tail tape measure protein [Dermatophilaceae bacterium]
MGQLIRDLDRAASANARLGASSDAAGKRIDKLAAGGAVVALGLGVAVSKFAEFDAAMSGAAAASSATGSELNSLRDAAVKAGADTQYSATEAANAITELSKAGVSTADILGGGLKGALNLAAAGQMDVAEAAETAATAMTQFKLKGDQVNHVADLLAAGAGKAQGSVSDMGMALKQAGLVASQTGLSIEETTAGLTAFASAGLVGSDAGTSFKSMLQRLTPQSDEAAGLMQELGISAYDAGGNFIGLEAFAGNLQQALKDLTPEQRNSAMATIFGSDAIRAASVLYEQGATGIAKWTDEVNQQGFAAKQAATLTDNLKGDVERLTGALDTQLIQAGSGANDTLRTLVQTAEAVVEAIGAIPGPILTGAAAFGALALLGPKVGALARTITGPLTSSVSGFSTRLAAARNAIVPFGPQLQNAGQQSLTAAQRIRTVGTAMGGLRGAASGAMSLLGGPWGVALLAATAGITMWAQGQADARAAADALSATIDEQTGKFTDSSRTTVVEALLGDLSPEDQQLVQRLGDDFGALADAALKGGPAYEDQRQKLVALMNEHQSITTAFSDESMATEGLLRSYLRAGDAAEAARIKQEILNKAKQDQAIADSNGAQSAAAAERGLTAVGDAAQGAGTKMAEANTPADTMSTLLAKLGAKGEEAQAKIDALSQALELLGGGTRAVAAATDAQAASIDKVKEAAEKAAEATEKKTGKDYSAAQKARDVAAANRDYRAALREVATDTLTLIDKQQSQNASVATLTSSYNRGRSAIENQLKAQGLHGAALQRETDKIIGTRSNFNLLLAEYKKTPGQVATSVKANGTATAAENVKMVIRTINGVPTLVSVYIGVTSNIGAAVANVRAGIASIGGMVARAATPVKKATGGPVFGAGTATSDSIPALLSNNEHVLTADDVQDAGGHAAIFRMRKMIQSGQLRFAAGGPVAFRGLTPGAYAAGGAVRAPIDQYYGDYIQSLGEEVTAAILAGLRSSLNKAISDQDTRVKQAGVRRTNTAATLRADRAKIAEAQHDVRVAKSKAARAAAQKRLDAAEAKYDKDRRNAAQATLKEDKAITAGKSAIAKAQKAVADAQARQRVQQQPELTQFGKGVKAGVKNAGAFIANLEKLASRGYVTLAQQLAQMSNEDAEKIAAQAATASKATLDAIAKDVDTSITQQTQLDNIQGITTIFGALGRGNFSLSEIATQSGMSIDDIIAAAKLIAPQLKNNPNAAKLLADLAELAKNGALGVGWFESGGYTGDGATSALSGFVHGKEFVFDAPATKSIGVANLEAMRRARMIPVAAPQGSVVAGRSTLVGLVIEGTLDTPWGPSQIRGVAREEIAADKAATRQADRQRMGVSAR